MSQLHLYNATPYIPAGQEVTFNLYMSAVNKTITEKEWIYFNDLSPLTATQVFSTNYGPVSTDSVYLEVSYSNDIYGTISLLMSSVGSSYLEGVPSIVLTDPTAVFTPAPSAYLEDSGRVTLVTLGDVYSSAYDSGITRIAISEGYIVPDYFTNNFKADDVTIDYGDGNVVLFTYYGGPADTFTHTFSSTGIFDLHASVSTSTETITQDFSAYINIINDVSYASENVIRTGYNDNINLPNPICNIPVNEFVSHEPINQIFKKLWDNFIYLQDISKLYQTAPQDYIGWGHLTSTKDINWHTNTFSASTIPISYELPNITHIIANKDKGTFISLTDRVREYSHTLDTTDVLYNTISPSGVASTISIKSFDVAKNGNIYILDARKLLIYVYKFNTSLNDYFPTIQWGGLGGVAGLTKFYKPNDIYIKDNNVYVTDSGNNCIKRFSLGGQWGHTYQDEVFYGGDILKNAPVSCTTDLNNDIYVCNQSTIVKFSYSGKKLWEIDITTEADSTNIVSIRSALGFIYVLTENKILRYLSNGKFTNSFADKSSKIATYKSFHINEDYNLYINTGEIILHYVDYPVLFNALVDTSYIPFDDIKIKPDEFVTSLTYNKAFHRLYDNFKFLYHSIESKIINNSDGSLSIEPMSSCDSLSLGGLPISKDEIYIGLNEIVTPEVMNRCIDKLLTIQQFLLDILMNKYSRCITGSVESFENNN